MSAGEGTRTADALRYLASRLVTTVLIVLGAMLLLFTLSAVVPGDPATTLLGPQATPELSRRFVTEMGLDQPLPIRLWRFFANALTGNLGADVISGRSVAGLIGEVHPYTLLLPFWAIGLAVAIGVPIGVFAATHRGSLADNILAFVSVAFIAVPSFVIAIFLLLIFAIWLDWLPVLGASRTGFRRLGRKMRSANSIKSCNSFSAGQLLILREVEKRTGKPAAFIETDLVDPRYFSAANVKNRLESYFQMIKAKRVAAAAVH